MKNNNQSMATIAETFFVEETTNLIHDGDALKNWNEKVELLQLEGQKTIVKENKSPIPFLWMNEALINTFETLCPTKTEISKFDKSPIPVELLDVVSLSVNEKYFDRIEVWYNEKVKDPVIVGYKFREEDKDDWYQKYHAKKYLMGRWADVKASLDSLVERAKAVFIHKSKMDLNQKIKDYQRDLEDMERTAENKFGNALPNTDMPF